MILHVCGHLGKKGAGVFEVVKNLITFIPNSYAIGINDGEFDKKYILLRSFGPKNFNFNTKYLTKLFKLKPNHIHLHGLWLFNSIAVLLYKLCSPSTKIIISPHGMLSNETLKYNSILKKVFKLLIIYPLIRVCDFVHATSLDEAKKLKILYPHSDIKIIELGFSYHDYQNINFKKKRLLYLGRIHHVKGLDVLIEAWKNIHERFLDWDLYIVGQDENNTKAELEKFIKTNSVNNIFFKEPVYDLEKKYQIFSEASIYVLPSRHENFGLTVLEALYCKTPVITTRNTPWQEINDKNCGECIELDVASLEISLTKFMSLSIDELKLLGINGHEWVLDNFDWKKIYKKFLYLYN